MQYTLRRIPKKVDAALRRSARAQGKTLTQVAIEALATGVGLAEEQGPRRSVADVLGALPKDPELEAALAGQRSIDPELW